MYRFLGFWLGDFKVWIYGTGWIGLRVAHGQDLKDRLSDALVRSFITLLT